MRLQTVLVTLVALAPLAAALPAPQGAEACAETEPAGVVGLCGRLMTADAEVTLRYAQTTLSCSGNECYYEPTMVIGLSQLAPGEWILRATSEITHYPTGNRISGTTRALECTLEGPDASCGASVDNKQVYANPFNSARWRGEWRLYVVMPDGAESLQRTGAGSGWLAQYHPDA